MFLITNMVTFMKSNNINYVKMTIDKADTFEIIINETNKHVSIQKID